MAAADAVQALFKCGDKGVATGVNFIFNGKDLLPLAALIGFGLADVLLQALRVFHAQGQASLALVVHELEFGVRLGVLLMV